MLIIVVAVSGLGWMIIGDYGLSLSFRMLQMLFRVCVEQKVITERKYASFGLLLEKIGKQATSWKQYNERGMKKQEDKRQ